VNDHATLLALALALDAIFGEPKVIWSRVPHPAVLMGGAVAWFDRRLNQGTARRAKGVVTVLLLGAVSLTFGMLIAAIPGGSVLEVVLAAVLLAQKSLVDHVRAVVDGIRISLDDGGAPFR
jgi:adenosylcobinamide-phosphate synthase